MPEHEYPSMPSDRPADQTSSEKGPISSAEGFASLGIGRLLSDALARQGMVHPRAVQAQVTPEALAGRDVISLAETGSGKTVAFLAPVIQKILDDRPAKGERLSARERLRAIVLCPTRELADQTGALAANLVGGTVLSSSVAVGTVGASPQRAAIEAGTDILVATPGRLLEFLDAGVISGESVQCLVIDEADRLFDMGFAPQVGRILRLIPRRQLLLFSATMPREVSKLADRHMRGPVRIETHPHTKVVGHVQQHATLVHPRDRVDLLVHLKADAGRMLVFCRTRRRTGWVAAALARHGLRTGQLHGDRSQSQRRHALQAFASGDLDVLVATDVGSRGLHIDGVGLVVNYDLPNTAEDLVHRAGRASHGTRKAADVWTFLGERDLDIWYTLAPGAGVHTDPASVPGFKPSHEPAKRGGRRRDPDRRHETRRRPGPGRRKRASRPIDPDQKPGQGVRRPDAD